MTERGDVVIIGAGANALSCATSLARAGRQVVCIEAAASPGGMAAAFDCIDGFRVPGFAQWCYPQDDAGNKNTIDTIVLDADGRHVRIGPEDVTGVSAEDAAEWRAFNERYLAFAAALKPLMDGPPPRLKHIPATDRKTLLRLAFKLRAGLGREEMYEFLRVVGMNVFDLLNEHFEDERLKSAVAIDAVIGNAMGPRTPGTVLTWLHRLQGRLNGPMQSAAGYLPALVTEAEAAGVRIRCGEAVERILVEDEAVTGVALTGGERIESATVISGVDAKTTFSRLVEPQHLDAMFATRVSQLRDAGATAHYSLALSGLPDIPGIDADSLGHRFLVTPDMRGVERAFNAVKYGEASALPVIEFTLPSLHDASLAPNGHVLSANVLYVPEGLNQADRTSLEQRIRESLSPVIPGLDAKVLGSRLQTPDDIAARCGQSHWHHGELSLHQSLILRPVYGAAQYASPINGLYLCSAACHPGGDLGGRAGRNAARAVLASERRP